MLFGGVENAILQYLAQTGDQTCMVVTHIEGMRAPAARELAAEYRFLGDGAPRLPRLLDALDGAEVAHLHVINDDLTAALAAQLSGVPLILQTLHNHFTPVTAALADHTICVGRPLLDMITTPRHATVIPNGIPCPDVLPDFTPWYQENRPLRILELRRPDKEMDVPLLDIARSGVFADMDVDLRVAGFTSDETAPGLRYLGPLMDPSAELAAADLVLHGSRFDTFGRVVYEAMAWGSLPVTVNNPAFTTVFTAEEQCLFLSTRDAHRSAKELRGFVDALAADPARYPRMRAANHARIRAEFSPDAMVRRTEALCARLLAAPRPGRSFGPGDLRGADLQTFGAALDRVLDTRTPVAADVLSGLPPRAAAVGAWALVEAGRIREPKRRVSILRTVHAALGDRYAVCRSLSHALADVGDKQQAVGWLLRAVQHRPGDVADWMQAAALLLDLGKVSEARKILAAAVRSNPGVASLTRAATALG
jgi:glycosyltransferase involved in cell wall biosynthesis